MGLPISSVMSCAICSTRRSTASAARDEHCAALRRGQSGPGGEGVLRRGDGAVDVRLSGRGKRADRLRRTPGPVLLVRLARGAFRPRRLRRSSRMPAGPALPGPQTWASLLAVLADETGCRDDGVPKQSDAGDADLDDVAGLEREVGWGHEARAGEQHAARAAPGSRGRAIAASSSNERRIWSVGCLSRVELAAVGGDDPHLDRERLRPVVGLERRPGPARTRRRTSWPAADRAGSSPSIEREDTSLPIVAPVIAPASPSTSPISGSGTSQAESERTAIASPGPTVRRPAASLRKSSGRSAS